MQGFSGGDVVPADALSTHRVHRQREVERSSLIEPRDSPDATAVPVDDALHRRQADTVAGESVAVQASERLEDIHCFGSVESDAVVSHEVEDLVAWPLRRPDLDSRH